MRTLTHENAGGQNFNLRTQSVFLTHSPQKHPFYSCSLEIKHLFSTGPCCDHHWFWVSQFQTQKQSFSNSINVVVPLYCISNPYLMLLFWIHTLKHLAVTWLLVPVFRSSPLTFFLTERVRGNSQTWFIPVREILRHPNHLWRKEQPVCHLCSFAGHR